MAGLFLDCNSMVRVNMSGLDFSSLSNMESLFLACRSLQKVVIGDLTAAAARGRVYFVKEGFTPFTKYT